MAELETYVAQVWSPDVRPLVDEAWRCYNAGAIRASIASTWNAVTADLIDKITHLADDGDPEAATFRAEVTRAQELGITPEGVRAMQKLEDALVIQAEKFELIDSIGRRELERIREDRDLCAHPSLRHLGEVYEPRPEVARGHLATALSTLLTHFPTQGRKALTEFTSYICDPLFVSSQLHIQATFFDRVRTATRRNIVRVAAKHALLEVSPPAQLSIASTVLADRMAEAIKAFALRDRELARTAVADLRMRFQPLDSAAQLRALVRLGDQDFFWDIVDQPLAHRLNALLGTPPPVGEYEPLPADVASQFALVRDQRARARLPMLKQRFAELPMFHRMAVMTAHPDEYFVSPLVELVSDAGSWRTAEKVGQLVVQHGPYLSTETLRSVLTEWGNNHECRTASMMLELAVDLFHATVHLGLARYPIWIDFLTQVRANRTKR